MSEVFLWLDSNVARSVPKVRELADLAKRKGVRIVVPAQVHLEICRQQRERLGAAFSPELVTTFLDQLEIEVAGATLDRAAAERWAELLHRRYPTSDAWKKAKLHCVKAKLPDGTTLPAHRVPMTTDWLIALEVEHRGAIIAVEDKGEEWGALQTATPKCALTYDETVCWLNARDDATAPSSRPASA